MVDSYLAQKAKNADANARRKRRLLKWLILFFFILISPVIFFTIFDMSSREPGITLANYRRLQVGMSEKDIQSLFGAKGTELPHHGWDEDAPPDLVDLRPKEWRGETITVEVWFDKDRRARRINMLGGEPPETPAERIGRWLRQLWK